MTQQATPPRPLPRPQPEWDFYWEKARAHELWQDNGTRPELAFEGMQLKV